jgi:hypothetical protein
MHLLNDTSDKTELRCRQVNFVDIFKFQILMVMEENHYLTHWDYLRKKSTSDEKGISLPPRCTLDISEVIY